MALRKGFASLVRAVEEAAPKAVEEAAAVVALEIKANAPVETGRLRDSVEVAGSYQNEEVASTLVTVYGGHDDDGTSRGYKVRFTEFGTDFQPPNPFIRRSVRAKKRSAISTIVSAIKQAIGKQRAS